MNERIIHVHSFNPNNKLFGKSKANDRAEMILYYCSLDNCPLFAKKQCINCEILGPKCPYGHISRLTGPTKRSGKMGSWILEQEKIHKDVLNKIEGGGNSKMVVIGEYVFLPYSHLDMNATIPILGKSAFFIFGQPFIKVENFNLEVIKNIIVFRPMALFGGEITNYQNIQVPKFLRDLQEVFPDKFKELFEKFPELKEKYSKYIDVFKNPIGRMALLKTVKPGSFLIDKATWIWDGKTIKSNNFNIFFPPFKNQNNRNSFESYSVEYVPNNETVIKITAAEQVDEKTVFVD